MKRLIAVIILALVSLVPTIAAPLASVQPLQWDGSTHCTTFSINESKGFWSTAYHCVVEPQKFMIAGQPAIVGAINKTDDTAVLVSGSHARALKLSPVEPQPGDAITITGFPFGISGLMNPATVTHGEFLNTFVDSDGTWNLYDITSAPGNSGSPVVGRKGVIGTLNFGWNMAGRLTGGTLWRALKEISDLGMWEGK